MSEFKLLIVVYKVETRLLHMCHLCNMLRVMWFVRMTLQPNFEHVRMTRSSISRYLEMINIPG